MEKNPFLLKGKQKFSGSTNMTVEKQVDVKKALPATTVLDH